MQNLAIRLLAAALIISVAALPAGAQDQKKGKGKKSAKRVQRQLQGKWTAKKGPMTAVLTIKGKKFSMAMSGPDGNAQTASGSLKIDVEKKPMTIDLKITKTDGDKIAEYKGKTSLGIFKMKKGKLTWCASEPGNEKRPEAFVGEQGHLMLEFTKAKKGKDKKGKDKKGKDKK